jgi:hypothetical protein
MRSSLLLLALVSFPVLACPNLAGVYTSCRSSTDPSALTQVVIEQKIINKYFQYTFTTQEVELDSSSRVEKYIADGRMKIVADTDPDTGIMIKTETVTTCQNNILNIKMNATVDAESLANITIKTFKEGNRLTQIFSGVSMGNPVSDTIVCE